MRNKNTLIVDHIILAEFHAIQRRGFSVSSLLKAPLFQNALGQPQ